MSYISVKGTGTVKQPPDIFGISLVVKAHKWEYADALKALNKKVEKIRKAVEAAGISRDELKTTSFDVSVDHEYEKQTEKNVFNGYLAQHEMKIEIPMDKEKSNSLIEKMTTGVTDLEFTIYFTVSNPEELHNEMLKKAIENATGRAEVIADAAGVKLGKISSISYSWNEIRFRSRFSPDFGISKMACMDEMAVPDFQPESIKESANVDISWGLIV